MKWEKGSFDASGLPIHDEPVNDGPRKRVERGGDGTKEWLLGHQAKATVYAPENLEWIQGAKASGVNKFELGEPGVVVTPAGSAFSDHS